MSQQPFAILRRPGALLVLAAFLGAPGPVSADWLVTREGGRLETKGAWTVKGKLVVFSTLDGKLSSLRLTDVDLDASRRVTEEAVAAAAQAAAGPDKPVERRKSVRVITDKDVRPATPPPAAVPADDGKPAQPASGAAAGPGVVVESWKQAIHPKDRSVMINGTLHNASSTTAADLQLKVLLYDETGALIGTSQAAVAASALAPGQKIAFRAEFPGLFSFANLRFEPQSRQLNVQPVATAEESGSDG